MLYTLLITQAKGETKSRTCHQDDNPVREPGLQAIIFNMLIYVMKYKEQREHSKSTLGKFRKGFIEEVDFGCVFKND